MPFKRKARVLFMSSGDEAEYAAACALRLGADWVDARTAHPGRGEAADDAVWADLFVTLCADDGIRPSTVPTTTRHVHWPVCAHEEIERRVGGMIGGMRLLARLDPVDTA